MKTQLKTITLLSLLMLVAVTVLVSKYAMRSHNNIIEMGPERPIPRKYAGSSKELNATVIVPTLNAPIMKGTNIVWCGSFLAAWKRMEKDLAGDQPILLDGNPEMARLLNNASDLQASIPERALYVATGWSRNGIINQIQTDLKRRFPDKPLPVFPGIVQDSFVAYSYLEASVKFSLPYNQNEKPLVFTDSNGKRTEINSFGLPTEDGDTYFKLRKQSRILFHKAELQNASEFAIDLCSDSSPSQIVVARVAPGPTLVATLKQIEKDISEWNVVHPNAANEMQGLGPDDVLLVPNFNWFISHHFSELEGRNFVNQKLQGQRLDVAGQDILFRLDKSGAKLKSEAKLYASAVQTDFIFDQPFLVYMKKRGAEMPYFVMWVDNAELLSQWQFPKERKGSIQ